jgi:hypothetical protein
MRPYVPKPQRGSSVSNGFFRKDEFRYDAERDAFICPAGQVLSTRYESKLRELTKIDYSNRAACLVCADIVEALHQKGTLVHPLLDRAEGMLNHLAPPVENFRSRAAQAAREFD